MTKIGIMGGTFDPIHNGHLLLGRQAFEEYGLDQVWYMPSGEPPHKKDHTVSSAEHRCRMVKIAVGGERGMLLSEFETLRKGTTYTADTLRLLREEYPSCEFYMILGADSLYEIENWYYPEKILPNVILLVADRKYANRSRSLDGQITYLREKYGGSIFRLHCREMDISSAEIRRLVSEGGSVEGLVPPAVAEYIYENHLYRRNQI